MKVGKVFSGFAFLCGVTVSTANVSVADDESARAPTGSFDLVSARRVSDVPGPPKDPSLGELLIYGISFSDTLVWVDGRTCDDWAAMPLDTLPVSIDDPTLSDTQIPPNDPPVTVGDRRQNIGFALSCKDKDFAVLLKVDERVLVTPSPSGLTNIILERPMSGDEILAFQKELKSMKFFDGEPARAWTQESLNAVGSYAEYRGAAYRFHRTVITENLLDGLGVLIPVKQIVDGSDQDRFSDYQPKLSDDTVRDYRPGLAGKIALLPSVTNGTFTEAIFAVRMRHLDALASPGHREDGNMPLGADEHEYVPSDEELLAAELGTRISTFVKDLSREEILGAWKGSHIYPPRVEYDQFTFRHVDVMGSGRFFYASAPQRVVIDFSSP